MKFAIFLRELRVGLLQELVAGGIVLAVLAVGGRAATSIMNQPITEVQQAISMFLFLMILLMGFSSGARTLSPDIRERQEIFLYSLPISRGSLWLCLTGGRFTAAILGVVLVTLAGSALQWISPAVEGGWAGLFLYPLMFAGGGCFSLIFRRNLAAYVVGIPFIVFVMSQIYLRVASEFASSEFVSLERLLYVCSFSLISLIFILLSLHFFRRGELYVQKHQVANQSLVVSLLFAVLILAGEAINAPFLYRMSGPWTQHPLPLPLLWRTDSTARLVSPGGRYLAVIEGLRGRPRISRVSVIETATGRLVAERRGIEWVSWAKEDEVLWVLCRGEAPFFMWDDYLGRESAELLRLRPEGQELSRSHFGSVNEVASFSDNSDLLLTEALGPIHLVRLEDTKRSHVFTGSDEWGTLHPWRGQGILVSSKEKVWQVTGGVVRAVGSRDAFLEPYLSFLREVEIKSGRPGFLKGINTGSLLGNPLLTTVSLPERMALYRRSGGAGDRAVLYDGMLGREILLPACTGAQVGALELIPARNSLAFLVRYQCHTSSTSVSSVQRRHFYYLPGSGSLKAFSTLDPILDGQAVLLAYLDERTAIWRPEKGETWKMLHNGRLRTLWPLQS